MTLTTKTHPHLLLAYGTLKRVYGNSRVFGNGGGEFVAEGTTEDKFVMTTAGFPRVYETDRFAFELVSGHAGFVHGDLWRVNDAALAACDRIEGHPKWYYREEVDVRIDPETVVKAWLYIMKAEGLTGGLMTPNENGALDWHQQDRWIDR